MKRITCRDLGEKLGLSHASVSLALRNHPSLPLKTRDRVWALATQLGYRPDPALSALNAYRQANKAVKYQATLGWLYVWPDQAARRKSQVSDPFFLGAQEGASDLGYCLEEFCVPTREHWTRLVKTCAARRIEGLLLAPMDLKAQEFLRGFPWEDCFAVAIGETPGIPMDLAINNQFQGAALAVRNLHALGYRKIGIVMPVSFAQHTEFQFLGGYLAECAKLNLPALFLLDESPSRMAYTKNAARWIKEHKPEAVIASGDGDILPVLDQAKLQVPGDIAVALLSRSPEHPKLSGIDQNFRQVGRAGANLIVDLMRRNMRGLPASPMRHLVEGTWIEASSTPRRRRLERFN